MDGLERLFAINNYYNKLNSLQENEIKYEEEKEVVSEGFLSQLTSAFKIKPHQNLDETLKKHEYPGYLNYALTKVKTIDDLKEFRTDARIGIGQIKLIKQRIETIKSEGESPKTKKYYKNIKKMYLDKGITAEDCEATVEWFENVCIKKINERLKEMAKKSVSESAQTDQANRNEARKTLSSGDIEAAKQSAKNVHDKAKKEQLNREIKAKDKNIKSAES